MDLFSKDNLIIGGVSAAIHHSLTLYYSIRLHSFYLYCTEACDSYTLVRLASLGFRACADDSGLAVCDNCNNWSVPFSELYAVNAAECHFVKCWNKVKYRFISIDCFNNVDLFAVNKRFYRYDDIVPLSLLCKNNIVCVGSDLLFCTSCGFQQFLPDLIRLPMCTECVQ